MAVPDYSNIEELQPVTGCMAEIGVKLQNSLRERHVHSDVVPAGLQYMYIPKLRDASDACVGVMNSGANNVESLWPDLKLLHRAAVPLKLP